MGGRDVNHGSDMHCVGCGAAIQTAEPGKVGYTPPSALEKEEIICQRCFRLRHYNEVQDVSLNDDDFLHILNELGRTDSLIVNMIDIFDVNGSWLPGLQRFIGNNPIMLIGNKVDLLPKSTNKSKLALWLKKEAKEMGLNPIDVLLVSSAKGFQIREAMEQIEKFRNGKDVYVVGCTNVGKSTFINRIIKETAGEENVITTSPVPGTTLDMINIPLEDGKHLVDTPGIINDHQMAHFIGKEDLKAITPKKEIKPRVYQLNERQTLFFGGLARLDYVKGGRRPLVCYLANSLDIHRTKLEKADELYKAHAGELLQPPGKKSLETFPELVRHEFKIKKEKMDIVFSGLGWVTVNEGAVVAAYAPKGVGVMLRKSLI
ncbi:ribosome biogenesis GTPase YqeH [Siminovitchia sp. 179-K 8D1 HS]|uniref:ribosome biogenesis GTPase YqeH n=1 Tax=Siminovitchia sp. 179-K 8D1 HS TaxID=3142385 RepID=UPI0039A02BC5